MRTMNEEGNDADPFDGGQEDAKEQIRLGTLHNKFQSSIVWWS